jgi:hypothetical protein
MPTMILQLVSRELTVQLSAEWLPTSTVVYQPPRHRVGDLFSYKNVSIPGPREQILEDALLKEAQAQVPSSPPKPHCLQTTYGTSFKEHDMSGIKYAVPWICVFSASSTALHALLHIRPVRSLACSAISYIPCLAILLPAGCIVFLLSSTNHISCSWFFCTMCFHNLCLLNH